jgi:Ca2+-binding EF-hand superfamily protein
VRKRLYELIISFDEKNRYRFEEMDIRKALVEILSESESEIAYVVKNVFRYDTDHDGVVTYEEFVSV